MLRDSARSRPEALRLWLSVPFGRVAAMHWDDPDECDRMPEDAVSLLIGLSFQPRRSSERTAWRGVKAGSRGVRRRR